jgi:hypothetical protein
MNDGPPADFQDFLFDADGLVAQVKLVRQIVRTAAGGDREASEWVVGNLRGLEQLLGEVERALTARN